MRENGCPACTSPAVTTIHHVPDHEYGLSHVAAYVRCGACGTLYQRPMPELEVLATFYPADYHSLSGGGLLARLRHGARLKRLQSLLLQDSAVVLDYGCGDGAFMAYAAQTVRHWRFWGFEIAEQTSRQVCDDGRVVIVRGRLSDLLAELPVCDLITMNHVIEHLPSPIETLEQLSGHLRSGGIVEGQTPAADSLEGRVFGDAWSGFHAPRHTVVFSRAGLRAGLERAGFVDARVIGAFNPAGIAVSLVSALHGHRAGRIHRRGGVWLASLFFASALYPIDRLSGDPGIVDFVARRKASPSD